MVILQVPDIAQARGRVAAANIRVVEEADLQGGTVAMSHLHPKDVGGAILSLDYMHPWSRWEWGGPVWRENLRTDVSVGITGAELQGEDPAAMASRCDAGKQRVAEHDAAADGECQRADARLVQYANARGPDGNCRYRCSQQQAR